MYYCLELEESKELWLGRVWDKYTVRATTECMETFTSCKIWSEDSVMFDSFSTVTGLASHKFSSAVPSQDPLYLRPSILQHGFFFSKSILLEQGGTGNRGFRRM